MDVAKIILAFLSAIFCSMPCELLPDSDNTIKNDQPNIQHDQKIYHHDPHHLNKKRSVRESDGSYGYQEDLYRDKSGGYDGSDAYSSKAGYGHTPSYGHTSGGYGGGDGNILQILTSLGILLALLMSGTALGAAMFGPFQPTTSTMSGIPTVPGMSSRSFDGKAGMGASGEFLQNTRAKFLESLENVFDKYSIDGAECEKRFVCEMYNKLRQIQQVEDIISEPERIILKEGQNDALLQAAIDGTSALDCSTLYEECDKKLDDALKQWQNSLD